MIVTIVPFLMQYIQLIKFKIIKIKWLYSLDLMNYYLLPIDKDKSDRLEVALRKINYNVDDRASVWSIQEVIDKIASNMTKENAFKMIVEFLPEPVANKFVKIKIQN